MNHSSRLLRVIAYITIFFVAICIILGIVLVIAGWLEKPMDTGAIILGIAIVFFYVAQFLLLRYSMKKRMAVGYWIAFAATVMPVLGTGLFFWVEG